MTIQHLIKGVSDVEDLFDRVNELITAQIGVEPPPPSSSVFTVTKIVNLSASIGNHSFDEFTIPLMQGYVKNKYGKEVEIINEGISGSNVSTYLAVLPEILAKYTNEPNTVFFLHLGGNDISIKFLDLSEGSKAQKISDMSTIYDLVHAQGQKLIQSSLTFRNYFGNTIQNNPDLNELEQGSYTYTRDWIVEVMKIKAPEFLVNDWPMLDEYNVTRNIYKDWRESSDSPDYSHPSRFARLFFAKHAVESIIRLSMGLTVDKVAPRNFNEVTATTSPVHFTLGFGRDLEVGSSTQTNINWVARKRPIPVGTESIHIPTIKSTSGQLLDGLSAYSYASDTQRRGTGNTADPTNSSATLENNVLLSSALSIKAGNGVLWVVVEGLEPMRQYTVKLAASVGLSSDVTVHFWGLTGNSTPKSFNAQASAGNAQDNIQTSICMTDYAGTLIVGVQEDPEGNTNNEAVISGIEVMAV